MRYLLTTIARLGLPCLGAWMPQRATRTVALRLRGWEAQVEATELRIAKALVQTGPRRTNTVFNNPPARSGRHSRSDA
jgi:hypothetical protein